MLVACIGCTPMQTFSDGWVALDAIQCKLSAVVGLHRMHSDTNCQLWLGCIWCTPMQTFSCLVGLHMVHSNANCQLWLGCIWCTPMQTSAAIGLHMMHSNANFLLFGWVAYDALQWKLLAVVGFHMVHSNVNCHLWLGCTWCTSMQTFSCGWVTHGALQCKFSSWLGCTWCTPMQTFILFGLHMMYSNANF